MVRVCTLFSGSSANSTFIEIDGDAILIDAGATASKTDAALRQLGSGFEKVRAIFVTHEHTDHMTGIPVISRKYNIPIIANGPTFDEMLKAKPDINKDCFVKMDTGSRAVNGKFDVRSFSSMHDSIECVGYTVTTPCGKIGIMTDCGAEKPWMTDALSDCKVLIVEANHDETMLWNGSYTWPLKKRVSGNLGHLSNTQSATLLSHVIGPETAKIYLAHLSLENNTPSCASESINKYLEQSGISKKYKYDIEVAPRYDASSVFEF